MKWHGPGPAPTAQEAGCCVDGVALADLRKQVAAAIDLIDAALAAKRANLDNLLDLRNLLHLRSPG